MDKQGCDLHALRRDVHYREPEGDGPVSRLNDLPHARLQFYVTAPYPCSYLPERMARCRSRRRATPSTPSCTASWSSPGFAAAGFLRRPHCDTCRACVPVRIPVAEFTANAAAPRLETARRADRASATAEVPPRALRASPALPIEAPPGGGMDNDSRDQYSHFACKAASTRG
jgi:arginine-tRNA-protein transferase